MLSEIIAKEAIETMSKDPQNFREIKPESDMKVSDAKKYWDSVFKNSISAKDETGLADSKQYFDDNGIKYREGNNLEPNNKFERNGYNYETDGKGRVICAEGRLQLRDHEGYNHINRETTRDVVAHGKMLESDDRGHLIADRFNGINDLENLVPMEGKLNKGDYARLESTLAEAVKDGADVWLKVEPVYKGRSVRPTEFRMSYTIDGEKDVVVFKNRSVK